MHDENELILRGTKISSDANGNICLNDIWALVGEPKTQRPADWHRSKRASALEAALISGIVENLHHLGSEPPPAFYTAGKGRGSKTFAHPVLALDYAEYLEPELGVAVREIFLRYRANDISLANDILDRIAEQIREDEMRVHIRGEITARNKELAGEGKKAGCRGWEYAELHNSGYRGLYNGLCKSRSNNPSQKRLICSAAPD